MGKVKEPSKVYLIKQVLDSKKVVLKVDQVSHRYEPDGSFVKIGFTSGEVNDRVGALQTGNPQRLDVVGWFYATQEIERRIHKHMKKKGKHIRYEWFFLNDGECQAIIDWGRARDFHKQGMEIRKKSRHDPFKNLFGWKEVEMDASERTEAFPDPMDEYRKKRSKRSEETNKENQENQANCGLNFATIFRE